MKTKDFGCRKSRKFVSLVKSGKKEREEKREMAKEPEGRGPKSQMARGQSNERRTMSQTMTEPKTQAIKEAAR